MVCASQKSIVWMIICEDYVASMMDAISFCGCKVTVMFAF